MYTHTHSLSLFRLPPSLSQTHRASRAQHKCRHVYEHKAHLIKSSTGRHCLISKSSLVGICSRLPKAGSEAFQKQHSANEKVKIFAGCSDWRVYKDLGVVHDPVSLQANDSNQRPIKTCRNLKNPPQTNCL